MRRLVANVSVGKDYNAQSRTSKTSRHIPLLLDLGRQLDASRREEDHSRCLVSSTTMPS